MAKLATSSIRVKAGKVFSRESIHFSREWINFSKADKMFLGRAFISKENGSISLSKIKYFKKKHSFLKGGGEEFHPNEKGIFFCSKRWRNMLKAEKF